MLWGWYPRGRLAPTGGSVDDQPGLESVLVENVLSRYHRRWVQWGNATGTHAYLLNLVGFNKKVLEIGCNTGYLSRVMQQRGCQVTGVEVDENAAELARRFCRRVIVGDVESLDWGIALGDERFDVITFGDVLEHLRAPEVVLRQLYNYLVPTGHIVVSLPNIAYAGVRLSLLLGRFEYASLGVLDETHLRFYTRETAQQLLTSSGFQVDDVFAVSEPVPPDLIDEVLNRYPQLSPDWVQDMLANEDAHAFQYVFRATAVEGSTSAHDNSEMDLGLTLSVAIFHRGDEAKFSSCLAALAVNDILLRQVIVITESEPFLEEELSAVEWQWQARRFDEGVAHGLNSALTSVDGDIVLFLDSGFVPQAGALDALVHRFKADATVGVVGSKILATDQRTILQAGAFLSPPVARAVYRGAGCQVDDKRWDAVAEVDFVSATMMAFRRTIWQTLEGFDEGYRTFYFDADFCARVWAVGYRVLVEPKALVVSLSPLERKLDWLVDFHRDRLRFVRQHYDEGIGTQDFFEAEMSVLEQAQSDLERRAMRLAYLWQLTERERGSYVEAESLLNLYRRTKTLEEEGSSMVLPQLQTHRFSSSVPLIGGLIARLRALWGRIAARWYAESVIREQNTLNRIMSAQVNHLLAEFSELEKLVVRLEKDLVDLRRKQDQQVPFTDADELKMVDTEPAEE